MKIMCQEHYDEVMRYAERIGDETLEERLNDLKRWERNPNCPCEIELYKDSAPYSFLFKQRYADGSTGIVGGLVYHGTPDRSGCYCEPKICGWEIHT
jgi:conserved domain protein